MSWKRRIAIEGQRVLQSGGKALSGLGELIGRSGKEHATLKSLCSLKGVAQPATGPLNLQVCTAPSCRCKAGACRRYAARQMNLRGLQPAILVCCPCTSGVPRVGLFPPFELSRVQWAL